jgi:6-pyruvoyltetrahydropterin/6-carboxytetrahydropterin synthase
MQLTRRYRFSASHRLHSPDLTLEENADLYGKCNHPFGHGHDYVLEVTIEGEADSRTGRIVPVSELDDLVHRRVLQLFASRNINLDVPYFERLVPTTENIVLVIARLLQSGWDESIGSRAALRRVHVQETARNSFELVIPKPVEFEAEEVFVNAESQSI